jgi:hypothetical protein
MGVIFSSYISYHAMIMHAINNKEIIGIGTDNT